MTREEISKEITKAVNYLGTITVDGYKNAKILVTGIEFLDALSHDVLLEDSPKVTERTKEDDKHDN